MSFTPVFHKRALDHSALGEQLQAARRARGVSVQAVAERTMLPLRALHAIEQGKFQDLESALYAERFLALYARFLGLSERLVLAQFRREGHNNLPTVMPPQGVRAPLLRGPLPMRKFALIPVLCLALAYLVLSARHLVFPPVISISSPANAAETDKPDIQVTGTAQRGSKVYINGEEVTLSPQDTFGDVVSLGQGMNTIRIEATGKSGKTTEVIRQVLRTTSNQGG